jgi:AbrB family looped-hinge helix DNA binding protein
MKNVTVSPKYQIVIPKEVRESAGLLVGESLSVEWDGKDIRLHRVLHPRELRGILKGHQNDFVRDKTDRF